ncbi:uncharacterized protein LOC142318420 [Lycorma delicatula]|uniref:uncharacterized protein LOC142318420 n=1 Tax=Lycorma delicatula TaxID=130591 RepID=UPI003F515DF2
MGIVCCRCPTSLTLLSLLLFPLSSHSYAIKSSRQYLPPIPGYIPVYIQDGDEPPDVESIVKQTREAEVINEDNGSKEKIEAARNVDDALKDSEVEIVQQLTRGPQQTVQHARLFFNVPSIEEKQINPDINSHLSDQAINNFPEKPS